jgi:hypothetical protein
MNVPPTIAGAGILIGMSLGLVAGLFPSVFAYRARVTELLGRPGTTDHIQPPQPVCPLEIDAPCHDWDRTGRCGLSDCFYVADFVLRYAPAAPEVMPSCWKRCNVRTRVLVSKAAGDWAADDPRIARGSDGSPLVSELVAVVALPKRSDGSWRISGSRRDARAFKVRTGLTIVDGRRRPDYSRLSSENRPRIVSADFKLVRGSPDETGEVVGVFSAEGSSFSEIWGIRCRQHRLQSCWHGEFADRSSDSNVLPAFDRELEANLQYPLAMTDGRIL